MLLHLWHLSKDVVCLSLFSDNINTNDRPAIVTALQSDIQTTNTLVRRLEPKQATFQHGSISDFVTPRSLDLFDALRLPQGFLRVAVESWEEREISRQDV